MRVKYSPIKFNEYAQLNAKPDTDIEFVNENCLKIDGVKYEFDSESVEWPDVMAETDGVILQAWRDEQGELWLVVRRFYMQSCSEWDTGEFHRIDFAKEEATDALEGQDEGTSREGKD